MSAGQTLATIPLLQRMQDMTRVPQTGDFIFQYSELYTRYQRRTGKLKGALCRVSKRGPAGPLEGICVQHWALA